MDSGEMACASFIKKILKFRFNQFQIFITKAQFVEKEKKEIRSS